jgi:hypothetical protein
MGSKAFGMQSEPRLRNSQLMRIETHHTENDASAPSPLSKRAHQYWAGTLASGVDSFRPLIVL